MKYAINIADLTKFKDDLALKIVLGQPGIIYNGSKVSELADCEPGRFDGGGAVLQCAEERAHALIQVLRMKLAKHVLRCYESKNGVNWQRI